MKTNGSSSICASNCVQSLESNLKFCILSFSYLFRDVMEKDDAMQEEEGEYLTFVDDFLWK